MDHRIKLKEWEKRDKYLDLARELKKKLILNRKPCGPLCWVLASFTASYQQLLWSPNSIGVPEGPFGRVWFYLPHLVPLPLQPYCNCHLNSTVLTSVLTELYNSSTATQSPTRSLKSHVWSSSSGNNCHAVHRSLSSSASLCSGIIISLNPPTRSFSITGHWNVSLPSGKLPWNGMFGRVEGQNTTILLVSKAFLEELKKCHVGPSGTGDVVYIDLHLFKESKTERKYIAIAWIGNKKASKWLLKAG